MRVISVCYIGHLFSCQQTLESLNWMATIIMSAHYKRPLISWACYKLLHVLTLVIVGEYDCGQPAAWQRLSYKPPCSTTYQRSAHRRP